MKKYLMLLFGLMLIASCGYKEGIIQKSEKSYFKFSGSVKNVSVQIDNNEPFALGTLIVDEDGTERKVNKENKLYQVSPGKHALKIYRNGELIVNRVLFLDNNVIKEVQIP